MVSCEPSHRLLVEINADSTSRKDGLRSTHNRLYMCLISIMFALTTSYVVVVIVELWTAFGMYSDSGSSISTSGLDDLNLYNTGSWLESTVFTVNVRLSRILWVVTVLMSCRHT